MPARGADLRAVFDAPTTTARDRKLLLRAMITDIIVTVEREHRRALVRIIWEGGAVTEHELTLPKPSGPAATDQDTLELVRRLAADYPDHQIAGILARQGRRPARATRSPPTASVAARPPQDPSRARPAPRQRPLPSA